MPYANVYFNGLPRGNFFTYRSQTAKTTVNFQFLRVFIALLILLASNFLQAQSGYIYVHLKSINEENSTDFSFTLKNSLGVTTNTFSLNDQATADNVAISGNNLHVYDMGLSHGTNGDGQLWVVAGTSFGTLNGTTTLTGRVYYRNSGSSKWQQPATAITNAKYIDGAYANQFVYINSSNNVIFYNNGTTTTLYSSGDAWDVTSNGGRIAISTATAIKLYSNSYTTLGISTLGASWTTLVTPGSKSRIDMNLAGTSIVYQSISGSNTVNTVSTTGTTASLGAVGIGAANNMDVAYDDNGVIYANANNTTYTDLIYDYTGGTWTAETQSRTLSTLTGGAAHLVYAANMSSGGAVESIFSRQTDNSGNIYWIDDERLKNSSSLNGNGIIIPVSAGTYTLTETLPSASYDLGRYNIYDPGGASTGNVSTQVVTFVVTAGEVVFGEYVNESLNAYSVNLSVCNTNYYLQTFDASTSSPGYVTPTFGSGTYGTSLQGTAYHYYNASSPEDGYYYLVNAENGTNWFVNTSLSDHTGNAGYFLLVNASYSLDEFYRQRLSNLKIGGNYQIIYYAANVNPPPALIYPNIKIGVQDNTGTVVSSASTGNITATTWTQYTLSFTATSTTIDLFLANNNVGGYGNDLAIDDIIIQLLPATTPAASGIESCTTGTGTITVSSPTGSNFQYSDNGGSSYQTGTTFSSLSPNTYNITANYTGATTGCASTSTSVVIISSSSIYGMDKAGLVYPMTTSGTISTAYNNSNTPSPTSTTADAIGYNASNGLFYYFLKNASTYTFNSYDPSQTTSSAYTTLASPPSGTGTIYIGGTTVDGNGFYAIDNNGYLYYYSISLDTWTRVTTKIIDNISSANLTSKISGGEFFGDITEDAYGDLWILISSSTQYGLYEITAPAPTTTQSTVTANQVIKYNTSNPASGNWSGMAFDATGNLYMTSTAQFWRIPIGSKTPVKITPYSGSITDLAQCTFTANPLPVIWSYFNAIPNGESVGMNWGTAQASSVKGFYIERSSDSRNWDTLAFTPYSDGIFDYSFIDASPVSGINYYRIAEVGYDNESNYSDIRAVDLPTAFNISIWPNPATDVLHVQYNGSLNNMTAVIIDELGRSIVKSAIYQGNNTISLSNMHSGIYFMLVVGANKEVLCKKIIEKGK